jgi:AcrR family transcriptional regulator
VCAASGRRAAGLSFGDLKVYVAVSNGTVSNMPAPIVTPRASWIEEGLRALGIGGPDAVRIEKLAQALGVSKGGFYWHFEDRPHLLEEMLDSWERVMIDQAIETVETVDGDGRDKLRRLFALARSRPGRELLKIDMAIRDWARRDKTVAMRLKRVDNRRMDYMRSLFGEFCADDDEVEVRCMVAFSLHAAAAVVAADHRGRSRAEVVEQALDWLLE